MSCCRPPTTRAMDELRVLEVLNSSPFRTSSLSTIPIVRVRESSISPESFLLRSTASRRNARGCAGPTVSLRRLSPHGFRLVRFLESAFGFLGFRRRRSTVFPARNRLPNSAPPHSDVRSDPLRGDQPHRAAPRISRTAFAWHASITLVWTGSLPLGRCLKMRCTRCLFSYVTFTA